MQENNGSKNHRLLGSSDRKISSRSLENHLGELVGKYYFYKDKKAPNGCYAFSDVARLELTTDGDFCLTGEHLGTAKNVINYGDTISIMTRTGVIYYTHYIFIDGSD